MEFCLMTEPQLGGTYEDQLRAARWCEERGLAGFARSDHYFWSHDDPAGATDAFAALAGLARETERIRLAVLVTPVTFRHPAVITKNAATIDQMSGGRFDLGVGTGWSELEHDVFGLPFPERGERFERLIETLDYLHASFADGRNRFEGSHYRLDGDVRPKPSGLGIIVGGSGPKRTPTLAGRYATEYNSFLGAATEAAPKIAVMRAAAEEAGRDPGDIRISMMGQVFGGSDNAEYQELMRHAAEERSMTVTELTERFDERGVPHGTPDRLGETFSELAEVGVARVYLQHLDLGDLSPLEPMWAAVSAAIS